jgi:hypothetical protein
MSRRVVVVALAILAAGAGALWRGADVGGHPRGTVVRVISQPALGSPSSGRTDRPLLWVQPPESTALDSLRLRASDWSGNDMGTVSLHCLAPCSVDPSPDGERLLARPDGMQLVELSDRSASLVLQPATVYDPSGAVVGTVSSAAGDDSSMWADDSRHLCVLRNVPGPQGSITAPELDLVDTGNGNRYAVSAGSGPMTGPSPATDFQSWSLAACSVISDRAVLTEGGTDGVGGVAVLQLSTGRLVYSRTDSLSATSPTLYPITDLTVSGDGSLAVEQLTDGSIRLRNLVSGAVIPWPGGAQNRPASVSSLSWHGLRAVSDRGVVDLTNGHVVWRPALATPISPQQDARPGSDDVVVIVGGNEVVVRSDGSAVGLWASFQPLGLPCDQLSSLIPLERVIVLC